MLTGSDVGSAGTFMIRVAAGLTTGGMAVLAAQPTDVVKVRMQAQGGGNTTGRRYTGVVQAYSHIARKEGVKGLWKGANYEILIQHFLSYVIFSVHVQVALQT